jgi:hypothetical protein
MQPFLEPHGYRLAVRHRFYCDAVIWIIAAIGPLGNTALP